jgi:hypothetical protein
MTLACCLYRPASGATAIPMSPRRGSPSPSLLLARRTAVRFRSECQAHRPARARQNPPPIRALPNPRNPPFTVCVVSLPQNSARGPAVPLVPHCLRYNPRFSLFAAASSSHSFHTAASNQRAVASYPAMSANTMATKLDGTTIAKNIRARLANEISDKQKLNPKYRPSLKIIQGKPKSAMFRERRE